VSMVSLFYDVFLCVSSYPQIFSVAYNFTLKM